MRDPWTMIPLEFADDFIAIIKAHIKEGHPLYGMDIFPCAKIEREDIFLIENDTTDTIGLLKLREKMRRKGKRMPYYKELKDRSEAQAMIDKDHHEGLEECKRLGIYDTWGSGSDAVSLCQ